MRAKLENTRKFIASCCIGILSSQQAMSQELRITDVKTAIEQMQGFDMRFRPSGRGDGKPDPEALKREAIAKALIAGGSTAVQALANELKSPQLQMRKNAAFELDELAGIFGGPKIDIKKALPALIEALKDRDFEVRVWSMNAIGALGLSGKEAVPALRHAMKDIDAGIRQNAKAALLRVEGGTASSRRRR